MIKTRTKTIPLLAEKGTWRQPALVSDDIPVCISSMIFRRREEGFSVSGTLWLLPGVALCFHLKKGLFSNAFSILTGKSEIFAVLFSSIARDSGGFLMSWQELLQAALHFVAWLVSQEDQRDPRLEAKNGRYANGKGGLGEFVLPHEPICGCFLW